jgi:NAD(P)-dependent dehydrogenase (short-subunit alcohol dehydrogenase family)
VANDWSQTPFSACSTSHSSSDRRKRHFDYRAAAVSLRCIRVDALINNAATQNPSPFVDLKEADWDRILAVNLKAPFLCAQASRPEP